MGGAAAQEERCGGAEMSLGLAILRPVWALI
jgi:hypothetical protein